MRTLSRTIVACLLATLSSGTLLAADDEPFVVIETNLGVMKAELFPERSPMAVANFLQYVDDGFYEGTVFHRVRKGVLVQGGGFTPALQQKKPRDAIRNEAQNRVKNEQWTLAAARSGGIHTATAQFFVNTNDNPQFDHKGMSISKFGYTVFGRIVDGTEVVQAIENIKTTSRGGLRDVPTIPVIIKSIRRADGTEPEP